MPVYMTVKEDYDSLKTTVIGATFTHQSVIERNVMCIYGIHSIKEFLVFFFTLFFLQNNTDVLWSGCLGTIVYMC